MAVDRGFVPLLRRIFRLWLVYAYLDLMWITRDVRFFLICFLSDLLVNLSSVLAVFLLASRFAGLGPWGYHQVLFMLGYAATISGLSLTFFSQNILHISRRLGRGQLDHLLVQPQSLWLSLLTEGFMPVSGSGVLLVGLGTLGWSMGRLGMHPTPLWLALLGLHLISSLAIFLAFSFSWGSLAFWAPRAAEEINSATVRMVESLKSFPLDGVGTLISTGLLTIFPVGFIAWYPSRVLLELSPSAGSLAVTPAVALLMVLSTLFIFRKGLNHYAVTGSQRYFSGGHRR